MPVLTEGSPFEPTTSLDDLFLRTFHPMHRKFRCTLKSREQVSRDGLNRSLRWSCCRTKAIEEIKFDEYEDGAKSVGALTECRTFLSYYRYYREQAPDDLRHVANGHLESALHYVADFVLRIVVLMNGRATIENPAPRVMYQGK
jgi:hypothetical protein